MNGDIANLYGPVIREHANQPRNCGKLAGANRRGWSKNPLCGDCVTIHLRVEQETIREASFESFGCALCRASASLLTEAVRGKTTVDALNLVQEIEQLVGKGLTSELCFSDLHALGSVREFPARIRCVLLPWETLRETIQADSGRAT